MCQGPTAFRALYVSTKFRPKVSLLVQWNVRANNARAERGPFVEAVVHPCLSSTRPVFRVPWMGIRSYFTWYSNGCLLRDFLRVCSARRSVVLTVVSLLLHGFVAAWQAMAKLRNVHQTMLEAQLEKLEGTRACTLNSALGTTA